MFRNLRGACVAILAMVLGFTPATAEDNPPSHLALVIGNAAYAAAPLPTAANDAGLMAETLAFAGFDVTAAADPDAGTLRKIVADFLAKAQAAAGPGMVVFVYVSGYGLQVDGENVLVPVDARIPRDVDVSSQAFRLSDISRLLDAMPAKARIFVYDLARATPFAKAGAPLASGLMPVDASQGSLVAFNTSPGTVALADVAIYGVYARTLSQVIEANGLTTGALFDRLRLRVAQITDGSSVPWNSSRLPGPDVAAGSGAPPDSTTLAGRPIAGLSPDVAFFVTLARDTLDGYDDYDAAFAGEPLAVRTRTMGAARREALIWAASIRANVASAYWTYMRLYPRGPHVFDARRRLATIHSALEPPPRFEVWPFGNLGTPAPDELALLAQHPLTLQDSDWIALPPPPDGFIPPPPPDEFDASLPPLPLAGALPLPMPRDLPRASEPGLIHELFVPGLAEVLSRYVRGPGAGWVLETTTAGQLLSRTDARREAGQHVVTQRNGKGAIISRTTTTRSADAVTIVQTGPTGGILEKVVTRTDAAGAHAMTITDGHNQIVAAMTRDKNGVITQATRGRASPSRQPFVVVPGKGSNDPPQVRTLADATPASRPSGLGTAVEGHDNGPVPTVAADPAPPPELRVEAIPAAPAKPDPKAEPSHPTQAPPTNTAGASSGATPPSSTTPSATPVAAEPPGADAGVDEPRGAAPPLASVPLPPPRPAQIGARPSPAPKSRTSGHRVAPRRPAPHRGRIGRR